MRYTGSAMSATRGGVGVEHNRAAFGHMGRSPCLPESTDGLVPPRQAAWGPCEKNCVCPCGGRALPLPSAQPWLPALAFCRLFTSPQGTRALPPRP